MLLKSYNFPFNQSKLQCAIDNLVVKENSFHEEGNYYSSYFLDRDERPDIEFAPYYLSILHRVSKELGLYHRVEYDCIFWMQTYNVNGHHNQHDHFFGCEAFSWVHFVEPGDTPCFYFVDSDGNKHYPPQEKNDFIIFPPWSLHGVDPVPHPMRTVIAGNILFSSLESNDSVSLCHKLHDKLCVWEVR